MPTDRKAIWGIPGTLLSFLWGLPWLFKGLLILMMIDFVTGFIIAWDRGKISSTVSRRGAIKKAVALCLVLAMKVLCMAISLDLDLAAMLAGYFCLTEAISIAENASRAGWALPPFLTKALAAMKDQAADPAKKGE